ncbi:MAG TPA: hypothetical protein VFG10_15875 [Saprospiraceae bacterium]|nr:hypothetical protein [Saprospiraceae bacterium]
MEFYSEDVEFLKELYLRKKVDIYFFHEKYMLSPPQLARSIRKFETQNIIIIEGRSIVLTEYGGDWIFGNRKNIFLSEKTKYWKVIPSEMEQKTIAINELYKPERNKIDIEIYKRIEDGV